MKTTRYFNYFLLLLILSHFLNLDSMAQCEENWVKSALPNVIETLDIEVDDENSVYGIGVFSQSTIYENIDMPNLDGGYNLFISKRNYLGNLEWVKNIEGDFNQIKPSLLVLGDQIIVNGGFTGVVSYAGQLYSSPPGKYSFLVLSLDKDGNFNWGKQFDNAGIEVAYPAGMCRTGDGGFVMTGKMVDQLVEHQGDFEMSCLGDAPFLLKMDENGNVIWGKAGSGNVGSRGWAVNTDSEGNILMAGATEASFQFDNNFFFLDAAIYSISPFVAKFDSEGNNLWLEGAWSPGFASFYDVVADDNGSVYVCGGMTDNTIFDVIEYGTEGLNDGVLVKYNSDGELQWVNKMGAVQSSVSEFATSLHLRDGNKLLVSGHIVEGASFGDFTLNIGLEPALRTFLAEYDLDGDFLEATGTGGTGNQQSWSSILIEDDFYIAGKYTGIGIFANDTVYPYPDMPEVGSNSSFQWKLNLDQGLQSMEADFSFELQGGNTYSFVNQSSGFIEQVIWDFGDGYLTQNGNEVSQDFFLGGDQTVCMTIQNCQGKQTVCKNLEVQSVGTAVAPISFVSQTDANAIGELIDSLFELRGVVYGSNFDTSGLDFFLLDPSGGINVYRSFLLGGYLPVEGDSLHVMGRVEQELGFVRFFAQEIELINQNNSLRSAKLMTGLGEDGESDFIRLNCVALIDEGQWTKDTSGFDVEISNGIETMIMRIDETQDLRFEDPPLGTFDLQGLVGQRSFIWPPLDGYYIIPRSSADFLESQATVEGDFSFAILDDQGNVDFSILNQIVGQDYQWSIAGENIGSNQQYIYTFSETGNYEVCLSTSNCLGDEVANCKMVAVEIIDTGISIAEVKSEINIYPNPVQNEFLVKIQSDFGARSYKIFNSSGQILSKGEIQDDRFIKINSSGLSQGFYFILIENMDGRKIFESFVKG